MKTKFITFLTVLIAGSIGHMVAQDYDDDIYYNPDKAKKTSVKPPVNAKKSAEYTYDGNLDYNYTTVTDYPAADTYVPSGSSTMDIDAYNRRGIFADGETAVTRDSAATAAFANTRNIERFYNPQVVAESPDEELAGMYYSEPANVTINISDRKSVV